MFEALLLLFLLPLLLLLLLLFLPALRSHLRRRLTPRVEDGDLSGLETSGRIALLAFAPGQRLPRTRQFDFRSRTLFQLVAANDRYSSSMLHTRQRVEVIRVGPGQTTDDGRTFGGWRRGCSSLLRCKSATQRACTYRRNHKNSHASHDTSSRSHHSKSSSSFVSGCRVKHPLQPRIAGYPGSRPPFGR